MSIRFHATTRTSQSDNRGALPDSGGELRIYSGAQPTDDTTPTGLLSTHTLSADAFAAASDNGNQADAVANAIGNATASGTGTAASFGVFASGGGLLWTGTVTATAGGGDLELDSTSITSGQTVSISSYTLRTIRNGP